MKPEVAIVGVVLILVGVGLCVFGYQKTQPTATDSAMGVLEQLSGESLDDYKTDKTTGYAAMAGGVALFLIGIGTVLASRPRGSGAQE